MKEAERMVRLTWRLAHGEAITTALIRREFGVSKATAKRDAALLDRLLRGRELSAGKQPRRLVIATDPRRLVPLLSAGD